MRSDRDAAELTFPPPPAPSFSLPAGCGCVLMRNDRDATKLTFPHPSPQVLAYLLAVDVCLCAMIETPRN